MPKNKLTGTLFIETRYINTKIVKYGEIELFDGDTGNHQPQLWFEYEDGTQSKRYGYDYAPQWMKELYNKEF